MSHVVPEHSGALERRWKELGSQLQIYHIAVVHPSLLKCCDLADGLYVLHEVNILLSACSHHAGTCTNINPAAVLGHLIVSALLAP